MYEYVRNGDETPIMDLCVYVCIYIYIYTSHVLFVMSYWFVHIYVGGISRAGNLSLWFFGWVKKEGEWHTREGDDTVGNPHRAQISQFELFELKFLNSSFSSLSPYSNYTKSSLSSDSRQQCFSQEYPPPTSWLWMVKIIIDARPDGNPQNTCRTGFRKHGLNSFQTTGTGFWKPLNSMFEDMFLIVSLQSDVCDAFLG